MHAAILAMIPKGNEKKDERILLFCSGFENLIFRRLQPLFFTVLKLYAREAGLSSGQYSLEILKVYFDLLAFVIFELHGLK